MNNDSGLKSKANCNKSKANFVLTRTMKKNKYTEKSSQITNN